MKMERMFTHHRRVAQNMIMSTDARRLRRYYGSGYLHFITTSCYQCRPLLRSRQNRDLFLQALEQVRK